jgi:hypothetical protein
MIAIARSLDPFTDRPVPLSASEKSDKVDALNLAESTSLTGRNPRGLAMSPAPQKAA